MQASNQQMKDPHVNSEETTQKTDYENDLAVNDSTGVSTGFGAAHGGLPGWIGMDFPVAVANEDLMKRRGRPHQRFFRR